MFCRMRARGGRFCNRVLYTYRLNNGAAVDCAVRLLNVSALSNRAAHALVLQTHFSCWCACAALPARQQQEKREKARRGGASASSMIAPSSSPRILRLCATRLYAKTRLFSCTGTATYSFY